MSPFQPNNQQQPLAELVHYFQVRSQALSDYSTRTWQRFNWFMTVHLGGFGLVLSNWAKNPSGEWYGLVAVVLALTALLWMALGYEDFQQMQRVTDECKHIEEHVTAQLAQQYAYAAFARQPKRALLGFHHARIIYLFPLFIMLGWLSLAAMFIMPRFG